MSRGCHNCAGCKEPGISTEVADRWHDSIGEVWDKVRAEQRKYAALVAEMSEVLEKAHERR